MKNTFIATLQKAAELRSRNLALHPNDAYNHTARAILLRLANQEPHPDLARAYEELAETYKVATDRLIQAHHDVLIRPLTDQNPLAHSLRPIDMMRHGWLSSRRQASQQ